jgi:hypothetical protein
MLERTVNENSAIKIPPRAIEDNGTVRMGVFSPPFPPIHAAPAGVADKGKVRMGVFTPVFPAPSAK